MKVWSGEVEESGVGLWTAGGWVGGVGVSVCRCGVRILGLECWHANEFILKIYVWS